VTSERDLAVTLLGMDRQQEAVDLLEGHDELESRCLRADGLLRLGRSREANDCLAGLDPELMPIPALPLRAISAAAAGDDEAADAGWRVLLERCEVGFWLSCQGRHALALLPADARRLRLEQQLEQRLGELPAGLQLE
jgi:hypothetical protein